MWGQFSVIQVLISACTCCQVLQIPFQCTVSVNYKILICCTCHFQSGSLFFILASSVCKSLQCLISTLTQGANVVTHLGSLVHLSCGEGGTLQTIMAGMSGECSQCMDHTGFAITQGGVCFLGLHCSGSMVLFQGTVPSGPCVSCTSQFRWLRFLGTPQGHRPR